MKTTVIFIILSSFVATIMGSREENLNPPIIGGESKVTDTEYALGIEELLKNNLHLLKEGTETVHLA